MSKELTVEELKAQNEALKAENAQAIKRFEDLNAKNIEASKEIKALKKQVASQTKVVMKARKQVAGVFEHESGDTYKFKQGFLHIVLKGQKVACEDLIKDEKAMNHLVEIKAGSIEKV